MAMEVFSSNPEIIQTENIPARVKAKAELWAFLVEISPEINSWKGTGKELVIELSKTTIRILFPYFSSIEITEEIKNLLDTLKIDAPDDLYWYIEDEFSGIVKTIMKND